MQIYLPKLLASTPYNQQIFKGCAILIVYNNTIIAINQDLIEQLPSNIIDFPSINIVEVNYLQEALPIKLLQLFKPVSLPLSQLTLKVSTLIILIQNLYLKEGLCNSTYLVIMQLRYYYLETQILTREFASQLQVILQI